MTLSVNFLEVLCKVREVITRLGWATPVPKDVISSPSTWNANPRTRRTKQHKNDNELLHDGSEEVHHKASVAHPCCILLHRPRGRTFESRLGFTVKTCDVGSLKLSLFQTRPALSIRTHIKFRSLNIW